MRFSVRLSLSLFLAGAVVVAQEQAGRPSKGDPRALDVWGTPWGPEPPSPIGRRIDWEAQARLSAASPRANAWLAAHPGWRVLFDEVVGAPWRAFGPGIPVVRSGATRDEVAAVSRAVAAELHDAWGLPGETPALRYVGRGGRLWYVSFEQRHDGVRTLDAGLSLRIDVDGRLVMWGGRFPTPERADARAEIAVEDARLSALVRLRGDGLATAGTRFSLAESELVYYAPKDDAYQRSFLAWRLRLSADTPRAEWETFVDARTGEVRAFWNDIRRHAPAAEGFLSVATSADDPYRRVKRARHAAPSVPSAPSPFPARPATFTANVTAVVHDNVTPDQPGVVVPLPDCAFLVSGSTQITDAAGSFAYSDAAASNLVTSGLDGPWITTNNTVGAQAAFSATATGGALAVAWTDANSTQAERDAMFFGTKARNNVLLRNPAETLFNTPLPANVGVSGACNAYYDGTSINFFPPGVSGSLSCINTAFSDTVVEHEYGHHVTINIYNAHGWTVPGHLGEGFSDAQSGACEDVSVVGVGFSGPGTFVRDMNNTCQWPTTCGTEIHNRGKLIGACYWHTRAQFDLAYGAAGKVQFDEYLYQHFHGAPQTETESCLEMLLLDDTDADLTNGTPNVLKFLQGYTTQHGVPFPIELVNVSHAPLGDTADQFRNYEIRAAASSIAGAVTSMQLAYSVDGGAYVPVTMAPLGAEWTASIPLQTGQKRIAYYLLATDSTGAVGFSPATAPAIVHTFRTYRPAVFYSDGFEGATTAWTTFATSATLGANDWQRQAPGNPNHAYDPATAFEGTNCFGNDLSPASNWNGLYQANVFNHLTSPTISCAGRTGVTLDYRRWLTVEDGTYDYAKIQLSVNGGAFVDVWQNGANAAGTANHVDAQWTRHLLRLPAADNQSAVQIRFLLDSDANVNLGGWNIDDLRLDAFPAAAPLGKTGTLAPNSQASLIVRGAVGEPFMVFTDLGMIPTYVPFVGSISFDPYSPSFLFVIPPGLMTVPGGGVFAAPFSVPAGLTGFTLWLEAVFAPLDGGPWAISNVLPLTFI